MSNATVAEFEKLVEGVYRDVNIALANELADLARALGIDFEEARLAANSQPYSHLHKPGPGVGGICIPVYPRLLTWVANSFGLDLKLTSLARRINEKRPKDIVELVRNVLERLNFDIPVIAVLGASFRSGSSDLRNSPSLQIAKILMGMGYKVKVFDPYVSLSLLSGFEVASSFEEVLEGVDIVVIATDHPEFRKIDLNDVKRLSGKNRIAVVDARDIIELKDIPPNIIYVGVGRPWMET